ncbi:hypothetical protein N7467_000388 [Penicillium canescens]|nr:hypothetical protein N7467_000388 [Penicillium canescens]
MSSSPFGEPPPGTDLSEDHRIRNNGAVISTYVIAVYFSILCCSPALYQAPSPADEDSWGRLDDHSFASSLCGANQAS